MPAILGLRRPRQEDHEFEAGLSSVVSFETHLCYPVKSLSQKAKPTIIKTLAPSMTPQLLPSLYMVATV